MPCSTRPRRRMPAVSTRTRRRPRNSIAVSRLSLVVPGTSLTPDQRVQEARLAHVGPSHDRDVRIGRQLLLHLRWKAIDDRIEQIARSMPLDRGDRIGIAEAELVELRGLRLTAPGVRLVRNKDDRLAAPAKLIRDVVLDGEDAGLRVDDEEDHVGFSDRGLGLTPYGRFHLTCSRIVEAAGVDQRELAPAPLSGRVDAVACGAGKILDDRDALADDAVEERRLPNVGPDDDGT